MGAVMSATDLDLSSLPKTRYDDDSTDRLNRLLTVAILILFSLIVTSSQYVGEPISCWVPAHFEDDHEDYTNRSVGRITIAHIAQIPLGSSGHAST